MAKKSKIAKNLERHKVVDRYAEKRKELKLIIKNPKTSTRVKSVIYQIREE